MHQGLWSEKKILITTIIGVQILVQKVLALLIGSLVIGDLFRPAFSHPVTEKELHLMMNSKSYFLKPGAAFPMLFSFAARRGSGSGVSTLTTSTPHGIPTVKPTLPPTEPPAHLSMGRLLTGSVQVLAKGFVRVISNDDSTSTFSTTGIVRWRRTEAHWARQPCPSYTQGVTP